MLSDKHKSGVARKRTDEKRSYLTTFKAEIEAAMTGEIQAIGLWCFLRKMEIKR